MASGHSEDYLPTLHGWRAFSILWVMACHADQSMIHAGLVSEGSLVHRILLETEVGLESFFALSGILITHRLAREWQKKGKIDLRAFYVKRAFRLLPTAWTYLLFLGLLSLLGYVDSRPIDLIAGALSFRNYLPYSKDWFTGHYWSLAVEEHYYLIWPACLSLFLKRKQLYLAPLLFLAAIAWRLLSYNGEYIDASIEGLKNSYRTDYRIHTIFAGCLLGLLLPHKRWCDRVAALVSPIAWIFLTGLLAFSVAQDWPYKNLIRGTIVPLLVFGTLMHPTSLVSRLLETRFMVWVGLLSYSLYVWQQFWLLRGFQLTTGPLAHTHWFPLNVAMAFFCGYLSYRFIESRGLEWHRRLFRPGERRAGPPTPESISTP